MLATISSERRGIRAQRWNCRRSNGSSLFAHGMSYASPVIRSAAMNGLMPVGVSLLHNPSGQYSVTVQYTRMNTPQADTTYRNRKSVYRCGSVRYRGGGSHSAFSVGCANLSVKTRQTTRI